MKPSKRIRNVVPLVLGWFLCLLLGQPGAYSQIATFENLSEGFYGSSFVDPVSGIVFTNPSVYLEQSEFAVEYAETSVPTILPGSYLSVGGVASGGAWGLTPGVGFEFTLPTPSPNVQIDWIYTSVGDGSLPVEVTAFAIGGGKVFQTNLFLLNMVEPLGVFRSIFRSESPMSRVVVESPTDLEGIGFDNIGAPPLLASISVSNHVAVLEVNYALPGARLLSSTNFVDWSVTDAEVTLESETTIFRVPIEEPQSFFRVQ